MGESFKNFINQVPTDIIANTEKYTSPDVAIFRPSSYLNGIEIHTNEYHACLPTSTPPPIRVGQREYQFKKGRILAFTPETRVNITAYAPTGQYTSICINSEFFRKIAKEVTGKTDVSFVNMNNPYTTKLLNLICNFEEEIQYNKAGSSLVLESISTHIVVCLLRETGCGNGVEGKKLTVERNYIKLAMEYMVAFYNANIRIEDICKQIHLSPYYFMKMFKKSTGQSPHEFLLSVRVSKAEEMLKKGGYSIGETAEFCGFANTAHFSNYFKKVKGISPSEYKKYLTKAIK